MRRLLRSAGLVGAVLALSGCWPTPGQGPDRASYNAVEAGLTPATVGELTQAWATATAAGAASDPVVSSAGVHVVVEPCTIATHRATDGTTVWTQTEGAFPGCGFVEEVGPPFVVSDRVMWGRRDVIRSPFPRCGPNEGMTTYTGATYHYDVATGTTPTAPAPPGHIVAAVRDDIAVSTETKVFLGNGVDPQCPVGAFPNGIITVGPLSDVAARRSFDTSGGTYPTLGVGAIFQTGFGTLATIPGDTAQGQAVRAYSVTEPRPGCGPTGIVECPLWATPVDAAATEVVIEPDQSTVYAGTSAGTVYALDATTGAVQWTAAVGASVTAPPALANGVLYVPISDGRLVALDAGCGSSTCSPLWETAAGSPLGVQPAVAGGVVYTGADDGSIDAFDAAGCGATTCPALWSAETGSEITGAPAVSSGTLYVGTADGRLIAYR